MNALLKMKIRNEFLTKRNLLMIFIIPLLISFICTYIDGETRSPSKVYSIAIIDHDKTDLSASLIDDIKGYDEIELSIEKDLEKSLRRLSRGKYDAVYEIKEGFHNNIMNRKFDDTLISHKESNSTAVKWINDQISLIVVRKWLYVDAFSRIRDLDSDFNEEEFRKRFEESIDNNRILSLRIEDINNGKGLLTDNETKGEIAFKGLWASTIIFLIISFGKMIVDDREKRIIMRLELCGLRKIEYYVSSLILVLLNIIPGFIVSYFTMGYFEQQGIYGFVITVLVTVFYSLCTWLIVVLIGFGFSSKKSYSLASQVYLLISIILGSGLLNGIHRLADYASWILPIKWYINF
ncbi:MAG: ABC transporter permease [Maledivibacter sp.]|jgi:hypothetical protein|nr:ABC transporter permease [Maledivibacter sp.]